MGVPDDAFKEATRSFDFTRKNDRLVAGYIRRRAEKLHKQRPGADALDLALEITLERHDISTYVGNRTLDLLQNRDKNPKHLDLATMSKVTATTSEATQKATEKTYWTNRADWMVQIVWRAMSVHDDLLWKPVSTTRRQLEKEALDEIVDRRLRAVEQLHCNVNSGGIATSVMSTERKWKVDGPNGPWRDGVLVRNFEYPFLPKAPFKDFVDQNLMPDWVDKGSTLFFIPQDPNLAAIHFPSRVRNAWLVLKDAVTGDKWPTLLHTEALTHEEVFREMFDTPRENFLSRQMLYCDQTGSAVNIEALEFGIKRRPGGPHTIFENTMTKERYVRLGPVVRTHREKNSGFLMSDDNDLFFENTFIDLNDLQIGDFVCFWNNHLYDIIAIGAWRSEYSHVMDIDNDINGRILTTALGPKISLGGHGLTTTPYSSMATNLVTHIKQMIDHLRSSLKSALSSNSTLPKTVGGQKLVQWSPYEAFDSPGAWWIEIPKDVWRKKWIYQTAEEAVKSVPRTVTKEAGGTGYNAPPDPDAIYFPLFEPAVSQSGTDGDSWRAYLNKRKADAAFRAPTKLNDLTIDGRLAQGLYYHGSTQTTIPVVRPKVRK